MSDYQMIDIACEQRNEDDGTISMRVTVSGLDVNQSQQLADIMQMVLTTLGKREVFARALNKMTN